MLTSARDSVIDVTSALAQLQGDQGLFLELAGIFLQEAPGMMSQMVRSLGSGELAELTVAAHKLRGCLLVVGGRVLVEAAKRLEETTGLENMTVIAEEVSSLQQGMATLTAELRALLDRKRPLASAQPLEPALLAE